MRAYFTVFTLFSTLTVWGNYPVTLDLDSLYVDHEAIFSATGTCKQEGGEVKYFLWNTGSQANGIARCIEGAWKIEAVDISHLKNSEEIRFEVSTGDFSMGVKFFNGGGNVAYSTPPVTLDLASINVDNKKSTVSFGGTCAQGVGEMEIALATSFGVVWSEQCAEGVWKVEGADISYFEDGEVVIEVDVDGFRLGAKFVKKTN